MTLLICQINRLDLGSSWMRVKMARAFGTALPPALAHRITRSYGRLSQ